MKHTRNKTGKTKFYRLRNKYIRNSLKQQSIINMIKRRELGLYGNTMRMNNEKITKKYLKSKELGNRKKNTKNIV